MNLTRHLVCALIAFVTVGCGKDPPTVPAATEVRPAAAVRSPPRGMVDVDLSSMGLGAHVFVPEGKIPAPYATKLARGVLHEPSGNGDGFQVDISTPVDDSEKVIDYWLTDIMRAYPATVVAFRRSDEHGFTLVTKIEGNGGWFYEAYSFHDTVPARCRAGDWSEADDGRAVERLRTVCESLR